jgi:hypothetical protein
VRASDYGAALRVDVTADNLAGSATASSATTAVVADTVAPTIAISSVATGGVTIAGWNLSLLLTATVAASDAESGLAGAPTCTVDGRSVALKDAGDGAWTVSVLNIGSHTVACTVRDKAGNRASASTTVKPGGARELLQSLLAQVDKAAATANARDAGTLRQVAEALSDALAPANWLDSNHLQPNRGGAVFGDTADAARVLFDLLKDRQSQVPDASVVSMLVTLVQVDRVLASTQVAQAIAQKANRQKSDDAKGELGKSDDSAADGNRLAALQHFQKAWSQAVDALR